VKKLLHGLSKSFYAHKKHNSIFYIVLFYYYYYYIFSPLHVCSEHIKEFTEINPRNVARRHQEQFSKWFESRVSTLTLENVILTFMCQFKKKKNCTKLIVIL
jgi:hypothetical protein